MHAIFLLSVCLSVCLSIVCVCVCVCVCVQQVQLPSAPVFHVDKFSFDDMLLSEDETVLASVRMFEDCGFIRKFNMDRKVCYTLL